MKKGTWPQALVTFFAPILIIVSIRWLIFEPFVIPSGSMIPTLLIHDHIFVNKLSFGVKIPFGNKFIVQWAHPKRGDIVVFRYPENPDVFYVKRILAVGGDTIEIRSGNVVVNGELIPQAPISAEPFAKLNENQNFEYFEETLGNTFTSRYAYREGSNFPPTEIPENSFFVVGDNRDQSNDSRFWGVVPESHLVGRAKVIWLSCAQTLPTAQFICDPQTLRWDRMMTGVR